MFQAITIQVLALFSEIVREDESFERLPSILDTERAIEGWTRECAREMAQVYLQIRMEQAKAKRARCKCGKPLPIQRQTHWIRHSSVGAVRVDDPYCHCSECGQSERPLHGVLGCEREVWSLDAQRMAMDFAADESCEKAVKKLGRVRPEIQMGRTTALRLLHEHGERAKEFIREKIKRELSHAKVKAKQTNGIAELEVEFDESMIPTGFLEPVEPTADQAVERTPVRGLPKRKRKCEWKGAKLGLVQIPGETTRLYTVRPTYELDEVFDDLLGLASLKGWAGNTQVRGIADGAPYIRKRMEQVFEASPFHFTLDRPHAKQHLYAAGERLHPFDKERREAWVKDAMSKLECGQAAQVVEGLRCLEVKNQDDELRKAADYFERNQDAVEYAKYRELGWSTASSEVESSHRHVVQVRLKIAGAWWHPEKVGNILALRVLKCNEGWWDEYWKKQDYHWKRQAETKRMEFTQVA